MLVKTVTFQKIFWNLIVLKPYCCSKKNKCLPGTYEDFEKKIWTATVFYYLEDQFSKMSLDVPCRPRFNYCSAKTSNGSSEARGSKVFLKTLMLSWSSGKTLQRQHIFHNSTLSNAAHQPVHVEIRVFRNCSHHDIQCAPFRCRIENKVLHPSLRQKT